MGTAPKLHAFPDGADGAYLRSCCRLRLNPRRNDNLVGLYQSCKGGNEATKLGGIAPRFLTLTE
uniref:Uncharacterized protein n=1 Tax=uncultured marine virus TaxID=186617 RepID=A0A0F7L250_9VIRU|nr:hypothetical protein [uncultured marine virus]